MYTKLIFRDNAGDINYAIEMSILSNGTSQYGKVGIEPRDCQGYPFHVFEGTSEETVRFRFKQLIELCNAGQQSNFENFGEKKTPVIYSSSIENDIVRFMRRNGITSHPE